MSRSKRTALIIVISVTAAGFLFYRFQTGGVTPRSTVPSARPDLARSSWVKVETYSSRAAERSEARRAVRPVGRDWRSLFASSHNLFAFVQSAAGSAFQGDGTAALYVSRAVKVCELEVALYGRASDPEGAFQSWLSAQKHTPELEAARLQRNFDLCKGFFTGNAFVSLPPKKGGYLSYTYWLNEAYADGNPVAQVIHVANELPAIGNGSGQTVIDAQATLIAAVSTGDPEAVFRAGHFLFNGHGSNMTDAYAVAIAGCDLGYDCSASNPLIFGRCAELGTCPAGLDFKDWVTKAIGSAGYAEAYEIARQLEAAISEGNTAAISKVVYLPAVTQR